MPRGRRPHHQVNDKARPRSYTAAMPTARDPLYLRHRFPAEVISHAVWLYFRFPLSLRMVEEMLATRGICVICETVRQWGKKFGKAFADQIRQRTSAPESRHKFRIRRIGSCRGGARSPGPFGPSWEIVRVTQSSSRPNEVPCPAAMRVAIAIRCLMFMLILSLRRQITT